MHTLKMTSLLFFSLALLKLTFFLHKTTHRQYWFLVKPQAADTLHSLGDLIKQTIQRAALLLYQAWYWQMLTLPARLLLYTLLMERVFFPFQAQKRIEGDIEVTFLLFFNIFLKDICKCYKKSKTLPSFSFHSSNFALFWLVSWIILYILTKGYGHFY